MTDPESVMYECDQCGACCKGHLIVQADAIDMMREPKLLAGSRFAGQKHTLHEFAHDGKLIMLACGKKRPCAFLGDDNRCTIYPTRPAVCVGMQAGDEQCQESRKAFGLGPLLPTTAFRETEDQAR